MKIKKILLYFSFSLLATTVPFVSTISCSSINKDAEKDIQNFIKNLNPKLKPEKESEKSQTLASSITTENQVKEWFNQLPESNNDIQVKFISSQPLSSNNSILEVKYEIWKGNKYLEYSFQETGFLNNPINLDESIVKNYISSLSPKLKPEKESEKSQTLASSITSESQVKEWFNQLPESNNDIQVKFISSQPLASNPSILKVIYLISKNQYSEEYSFQETGFKRENGITFKEFSEKNSFRITLQISDHFTNEYGQDEYFTNSGTAWSWYYKQTADYSYDWYLMTNFHVVTNAIAYTNGYLKLVNNKPSLQDYQGLINFYSKNTTTNFKIDQSLFSISTYNDVQKYQSLININDGGSPTTSNTIGKEVVQSVELITDFNNDSIDLFSKSEQNQTLYNLDMALVKISMDFNNHQNRLNNTFKRPDVVSTYFSNPEQYNSSKFSPSKWTSIGGHPKAQDKLTIVDIGPDFYLDYSNLSIFDFVLTNLKAPYYYTQKPISNFLLTPGASGSAAYQLQDINKLNINSFEIPIGIFWGGQTVLSNEPNSFAPSVIPFIINDQKSVTYNIFNNFKNSSFGKDN